MLVSREIVCEALPARERLKELENSEHKLATNPDLEAQL